jgi:FdhD protein
MKNPLLKGNFDFVNSLDEHSCKSVVIERYAHTGIEVWEDSVIKEDRVDFLLNGKKFLSVMCIAKHQVAHIVGFLLSEAVVEKLSDIDDVILSDDGLQVDVIAAVSQSGYENLFREKTLTSGCCIGVTGSAQKSFECSYVKTKYKVAARTLLEKIGEFNKPSALFDTTGCVHKAQLILEDGTEFTTEDIGRHNAIDKVVGQALLEQKSIKKSVLFVSGRLSMEMIVKCVMHKVPIVVSKAAVTYQGLKVAHEHGITLVGFARDEKMNIYTHSGRIMQ